MDDAPGADSQGSQAGSGTGFVDTVADVVFDLTDQDVITHVRTGAEEYLDYDSNELVGRSLSELLVTRDSCISTDTVPPDSFVDCLGEAGEVRQAEVLVRTDGETDLPMTLSARRTDDGRIRCAGVVRDESGRASDGLSAEALGAAVYRAHRNGTIEWINNAMVQYTGYDRTELIGRSISELLPAADHAEAVEHIQTEDAESTRITTNLIGADGTTIPTEINLTTVSENSERHTDVTGVLRDISDRKRREHDLSLLTDIYARVFRHNLRNELSSIKGYAGIIDERVDESLREYTSSVIETTDRLHRHSEKALLLKEVVGTTDRREVDLVECLDTVVAEARQLWPEAVIEVDTPAEAIVEAHPQIKAAVSELVENAVRHSPRDEPGVEMWFETTDDARTLFIEDDSGGLAAGEIAVLRRGSETSLEHTSGLGLWLVRWIVDQSDAEFIVHQTDDGSLMGIRFPIRDAAETIGGLPQGPIAAAPAHVREDFVAPGDQIQVVGRETECNRLAAIYEHLDETGGQTVLIAGESGIGKTTLIEQFQDSLETRSDKPLIGHAACQLRTAQPFGGVRRAMAGFSDELGIGEALDNRPASATNDPEGREQRQQAVFATVAEKLETAAQDRPVALVLEDLQNANRETAALFEYLADRLERSPAPVLLLGTYRPADIGQSHPITWIATEADDRNAVTVLELEPFDDETVESQLASMFTVESFPHEVVSAVRDHTGGNPLFVAEVGHHLREAFGPFPSPESIPSNSEALPVPETVEVTITERLERFDQSTVVVLELAAVVGRTVPFDVLRAAHGRSDADLVERVDQLVDQRILERASSSLRFEHQVIRQTILDRIDDERRATLHARVAEAIETVHEDSLTDHYGSLAEHHDVAGNVEEAVRYYQLAGDQASDAEAYEAAETFYERALDLAEGDTEELGELLDGYARTLEAISQFDQARDVAKRALDQAPAESERHCRLLDIVARTHMKQSQFEQARETFDQQQRIAEAIGDSSHHIDALCGLAATDLHQGQFERAREQLLTALDIVASVGDDEQRAAILKDLGNAAVRLGAYEEAQDHFEAALEVAVAVENSGMEADCRNGLGVAMLRQGQLNRAWEHIERTLDIRRDIGDRRGAATCLNNLGGIAEMQADYEEAVEYHERALEIRREIGDRKRIATSLDNLGNVAFHRGNYDDAADYYEESLEIKRDIGDRQALPETLSSYGQLALNQGRLNDAYEKFDESRTITEDTGNLKERFNAQRWQSEVMAMWGKHDQAIEEAQQALESTRDAEEKRIEMYTLVTLGTHYLRKEQYDDASSYAREAHELAVDVGFSDVGAKNLLGRIEYNRDNTDEARSHFNYVLETAEGDAHRFEAAQATLFLAHLDITAGELQSASHRVKDTLDTFEALGASFWVGKSRQCQGILRRAENELEAAIDHFEAAHDVFESVGTPDEQLVVSRQLVDCYRKLGISDEARKWCRNAENGLSDASDSVTDKHSSWITEAARELGFENK